MKERAPYMPWYGREFYADENVQVMTLEQEGAYQRLLWNCWQEGSLPADTLKLAAICKNIPLRKFERMIWPALAGCFSKTADGRLLNPKVESIRQAKETFRSKCSEAGKRGNLKRWGPDQVPDENPIETRSIGESGCDREPIASDFRFPTSDYRLPETRTETPPSRVCVTPIPGVTGPPPNDPPNERFEEAWALWPLKVERDAAARAWLSVVRRSVEESVFACIGRYLGSDQVSRGVVAKMAGWLFQQARDGWQSDWPAAKSAQQRKQAEIDRDWELIYGTNE
jgi:uncharacterized protein YdaU (DUF1376 family)